MKAVFPEPPVTDLGTACQGGPQRSSGIRLSYSKRRLLTCVHIDPISWQKLTSPATEARTNKEVCEPWSSDACELEPIWRST